MRYHLMTLPPSMPWLQISKTDLKFLRVLQSTFEEYSGSENRFVEHTDFLRPFLVDISNLIEGRNLLRI